MKKNLCIAFCATGIIACSNHQEEKAKTTDTAKIVKTDSPAIGKQSIAIDNIDFPGSVAYAVFQEDGKTLFYYNVDTKKGFISINKTKYDFTEYKHTINEPDYTLKSGDKISVKIEGTKFQDYENPEPGILKGRAAKVTIIMGAETLVLENKVDVIDGTNAD